MEKLVYYSKGKLIPCKTCKWYSKCIVPKNIMSHHRNYRRKSMRKIYRCEDYTPRTEKQAEQT